MCLINTLNITKKSITGSLTLSKLSNGINIDWPKEKISGIFFLISQKKFYKKLCKINTFCALEYVPIKLAVDVIVEYVLYSDMPQSYLFCTYR